MDDVSRTARDLEAAVILPDTGLSAEDNVELLLRAVRMMQLGLEVQLSDHEAVLQENNQLRDDMKVRCSKTRTARCCARVARRAQQQAAAPAAPAGAGVGGALA